MTKFPHDFDFAYNGTLNEKIVGALLTLDCMREGGNVALIGGAGTGKTTIADALRARSESEGLSSELIFFDEEKLESAHAATGVLVIDEFDGWLKYQTASVLRLLAMRSRNRLSTIVTVRAESLQYRFTWKIDGAAQFSGPLAAFRSKKSIAGVYNRLGLWLDARDTPRALFDRITVPQDFGARSLVELYGIYPMQWLEPTAAPLPGVLETMRPWTVLNLGTKSWREVLKAREHAAQE